MNAPKNAYHPKRPQRGRWIYVDKHVVNGSEMEGWQNGPTHVITSIDGRPDDVEGLCFHISITVECARGQIHSPSDALVRGVACDFGMEKALRQNVDDSKHPAVHLWMPV